MMLQPGAIPSNIICLTGCVTSHNLTDDGEYEDIMEDIKVEAAKFGPLVNIVMPRPNPNRQPIPGVGKVFLYYADAESASVARIGFNGRKFAGNQVVSVFYPENLFAQGHFDG